MTINGHMTSARLLRLERMKRVEKFMRRGYTNQHEIAAAVGVSHHTVGRYIKYINLRWKRESPGEYQEKITHRIRQLENIMQEAYLAYDKSKKGEETQSWLSRPCTACAGAENVSEHPDPPCSECGGTGKVTTMHSAIKDSAGDPAYLQVVHTCIKECARLETLLLNGGQMRPQKITIEGTVTTLALQVPAEYAGVANDKLLEARQLLNTLFIEDAKSSNPALEGKIVKRELTKEKEAD